MTNAGKRRILGFTPIIGIVLYFVIAFVLHKSSQFFWALWLFAHLPFLVAPFYCVFIQTGSAACNVGPAVMYGWGAWLVSAILWEIGFGLSWQQFNWGPPDLPGELLIGSFLGWLPAAVLTCIALIAKAILDRALPVQEVHIPPVEPDLPPCGPFDAPYPPDS